MPFSSLGRQVSTLAAKLNAKCLTLALLTPAYMETHRIQFTMDRQVSTLRVAKIALQAKRFVIALRPWIPRAATPGEAVSQRQTVPVGPELAWVGRGRDKVGTGHRRSPCRSYSNLPRR
jgi:hypothetical protein